MQEFPLSVRSVRFGVFEVDLRLGELRKKGTRIRLQGQPYVLLITLLKQPGELVTREEIQEALWPNGTTVEFSQGLNFCIRQIRAALSEVYDPEIGIDIVSLGLIYGTNIDDDGLLTIDMTLTTPYCPMGPIIETQAHAVCAPLPGVRDVHINLVWAPPWDPRTMASDEAQLELGIY